MADFDDPVIQALEAYLPQLTGQDHSNVEWVLQTLV
jgi:DNA-binding protein Fis